MSCKTISIEELASITPVSPPTVNKTMKPRHHRSEGEKDKRPPLSVPNHLKTLIPVGTAIIIVADVK